MRQYFVARFAHTRGRYLVEQEAGGYGGQRIMDRRQEKHGNKPDPSTGLYLHEMYRWFGPNEVTHIKPFTRKD